MTRWNLGHCWIALSQLSRPLLFLENEQILSRVRTNNDNQLTQELRSSARHCQVIRQSFERFVVGWKKFHEENRGQIPIECQAPGLSLRKVSSG